MNLGGDLAFIGWCAAEAPNQQLEAVMVIESFGEKAYHGMGWKSVPNWMMAKAHPERPNWQIVSAYSPSGDLVSATFDQPSKGWLQVFVRAADWQTGQPIHATVIVRIRCASKASREPWQEEPDQQRRAASFEFHASTRRHHGK